MIPFIITAGVTFDHELNLTAYPADSWTLTLHMRGPSSINLAAVANDNRHQFSASAAETSQYKEGPYHYVLRATNNADEVVQVDQGIVEVIPDLLGMAEGTDTRSHAKKVLDAIEAVIEGRAQKDQAKYKINNRELERTPIPDLLQLRKTYKAEVYREQRKAKGQSPFQSVKVRFG